MGSESGIPGSQKALWVLELNLGLSPACVPSGISRVQLFATLWTVAH